MFIPRSVYRVFVVLLLLGGLASPAEAADIKLLVKEANAKFRAIDNTNDDSRAKVLFAEAQSLLEQIAAQNPTAPDLAMLKTKAQRAATRFETWAPANAPANAVPKAAPGPAVPNRTASAPAREEVVKDWAAFVQLHDSFVMKVNPSFPQPGVITYAKNDADRVLALLDDLQKNDVPAVKQALAARIYGNWVTTKRDLIGQTIQWGLPVYVASAPKGSTEIVRVFRMTVLGAEGSGATKTPPFIDHWTGDSYRMRAKNLPRD